MNCYFTVVCVPAEELWGCFREEYGDLIEVEVYRGLYDGRLHEHREAELLEWISLMAVFEPSRHP